MAQYAPQHAFTAWVCAHMRMPAVTRRGVKAAEHIAAAAPGPVHKGGSGTRRLGARTSGGAQRTLTAFTQNRQPT